MNYQTLVLIRYASLGLLDMRSEGLFPAFQHHYRHRKRREKEVKIKSSVSELVLLEWAPAKPWRGNAGKQFNVKVWNTKGEIWAVVLNQVSC